LNGVNSIREWMIDPVCSTQAQHGFLPYRDIRPLAKKKYEHHMSFCMAEKRNPKEKNASRQKNRTGPYHALRES
jgi:hypothetical protein